MTFVGPERTWNLLGALMNIFVFKVKDLQKHSGWGTTTLNKWKFREGKTLNDPAKRSTTFPILCVRKDSDFSKIAPGKSDNCLEQLVSKILFNVWQQDNRDDLRQPLQVESAGKEGCGMSFYRTL